MQTRGVMPRYRISQPNGQVTEQDSPMNFKDFADFIRASYKRRGMVISRITNLDYPADVGIGGVGPAPVEPPASTEVQAEAQVGPKPTVKGRRVRKVIEENLDGI